MSAKTVTLTLVSVYPDHSSTREVRTVEVPFMREKLNMTQSERDKVDAELSDALLRLVKSYPH